MTEEHFLQEKGPDKELVLLSDAPADNSAERASGIRDHLVLIQSQQEDFPVAARALAKADIKVSIIFVGRTPAEDLIYIDILARPPSSHQGVLYGDLPDDAPLKRKLQRSDLERYRQQRSAIDQFEQASAEMPLLRQRALDEFKRRGRVVAFDEEALSGRIPPYAPLIASPELRSQRNYSLPWEKKSGGNRARKRKRRS
ncbi:hypothetical protein [Acetobacter persici]|uniref:Uncharacterized protein n=1 Tax=Acetobacter persici TaxID=1076596 RepID=A0A1U9LJF7_9PROT|nr:hypothetical protein [Acetobacter persici]AQT06537.1 hypothetical protein A0U91_16145 [Acetobacter persici]